MNDDFDFWRLLIFITVIAAMFATSIRTDRSELRDAQRRIATLEQRCK